MTDQQTEDPTSEDVEVETLAPVPEETPNAAETDQGDAGDDSSGNKEAAKWRKKLREREAELTGQVTALQTTVDALQRAEVGRLAEADNIKAQAIWASGAELADLLADDGTVDPDKVKAAVEHARQELGIPRGGYRRSSRQDPGANPQVREDHSDRAAALKVVMGRGDSFLE